jgi:hypothetical protein
MVLKIKMQQGLMEKITMLFGFKLFVFSNPGDPNPEQEIRLPLRFLANERKPEYQFTLKSVPHSRCRNRKTNVMQLKSLVNRTSRRLIGTLSSFGR